MFCVVLSGLCLKSLLSLRWSSAVPIPCPTLDGAEGTEGQDLGLPRIVRRQRTRDNKAYFLKYVLQ